MLDDAGEGGVNKDKGPRVAAPSTKLIELSEFPKLHLGVAFLTFLPLREGRPTILQLSIAISVKGDEQAGERVYVRKGLRGQSNH